jgi:hypothetical protein
LDKDFAKLMDQGASGIPAGHRPRAARNEKAARTAGIGGAGGRK